MPTNKKNKILLVVRDISYKSAGLSISTFLRYRALNLIKNTEVKILTSVTNLKKEDYSRINEEIKYESLILYKEFKKRIPSIFEIKKIYKNIKDSSIIYIYSFYQPISYISFFIGKLLGKEIWFRPHGSLMNAYTVKFSCLKNLYTYLELILYSFSKNILLSSKSEENDFKVYLANHIRCKAFLPKIKITRDSFDLNKKSNFFNNQNINYDHKFRNIDLIFLSRLVEIKGIFLFLDALVSLCEDKTFNNELNIVIAGIPSPEFIERYSKYEKIFRNSKNIKINYCGLLSQEEKWELLHQSKNYILPTFGDSFGIAAIEALFSNVKVAASKRLGCSEILRNLKSFNYIELNKNSIKEYIKSIYYDKTFYGKSDHKEILEYLERNLSIKKQSKDYQKVLNN